MIDATPMQYIPLSRTLVLHRHHSSILHLPIHGLDDETFGHVGVVFACASYA
jgi:hypothetical protein